MLTLRLEVHRDDLAAHPFRLFGALLKHERGSVELGARQRYRLAGLGGEEGWQIDGQLEQARSDALERGGAGV
jgi:hypothetical protein